MERLFSLTRALVARKRKIFALFFALAASVGLSWATTVTWNNSTLSSIAIFDDGQSFTEGGVKLTALSGTIDGEFGEWKGYDNNAFKFSTSLGNFTRIEITGTIRELVGSGWTETSPGAVWTGDANEATFGDYFEKVTKFWLDRGVDGFRLDAIKHFEDKDTDGVEFMKWFYQMAQGYNPDVYMVGENWSESGDIYEMYDSGIDSQFNFKFAGNGGEFIVASHGNVADMATKLKKFDDNIKKHNEKAINANFLSNHDMLRLYSMLDEEDNKMAAALYMLAPGNTFTYYGEEIGIEAPSSNGDANYHTAMIWDNENLPATTKQEILPS